MDDNQRVFGAGDGYYLHHDDKPDTYWQVKEIAVGIDPHGNYETYILTTDGSEFPLLLVLDLQRDGQIYFDKPGHKDAARRLREIRAKNAN